MTFRIISIILLLLPEFCWSATYFVRPDGHDTSCNGTADASVASAPKCAYLTIKKAANVVAAGDTVTVKGTNTYAERVTISTNGGTGNPSTGTCDTWITFQGSPARTATTHGFRIAGNCIEVKDFNVTSGGANLTCTMGLCRPGVSIGKSYIKVTNNYITNWRDVNGISMDPTEGNLTWADRGSWVTISNNTIYNSQNGIGVWGDHVTVTGNEVNRLRAWVDGNDCDYSRAWGNNITFRKNFFHGTVRSEIAYPGGLHAHVDCIQTFAYHSGTLTNLSFDKNWCSDTHSLAMIQGGTNSNINFTNNVVWANGMTNDNDPPTLGAGASIANGTHGSLITNNIFFETSNAAICYPAVTGCIIKNNIVQNANCGTTCNYAWQCFNSDCIAEDYNLAYRTGGGAIYNEIPGRFSTVFSTHDIHDINPLFVNPSNPLGADRLPFTSDDGLRLQTGSPAIGKGYGGVEMGAYEYITGMMKKPMPVNINSLQ